MSRDDSDPPVLPMPHDVIRLADRRVRLHTRTATSDPDREVTADVDEDGLVLRDDVDLGREAGSRYVWLDFDLADGNDEPVRALGEVMPRSQPEGRHAPGKDAMGLALDIKFKHLFPDHKRRLLVALGKAGRG